MAITTQKKQPKPGKRKATPSAFSRLKLAGIAILVAGLLAFGVAQLMDANQPAISSAVKGNPTASPGVNSDPASNQESGTDSPIDATDLEAKYLGPPTDVANLSLAEAGQAGQPVLVWFHADW
ncbi:MAG: hypothetical protein HC875_27725 [Anaerolineales bacterium]|nr:hypothetical protein [Anaerolineales bacterium]